MCILRGQHRGAGEARLSGLSISAGRNRVTPGLVPELIPKEQNNPASLSAGRLLV